MHRKQALESSRVREAEYGKPLNKLNDTVKVLPGVRPFVTAKWQERDEKLRGKDKDTAFFWSSWKGSLPIYILAMIAAVVSIPAGEVSDTHDHRYGGPGKCASGNAPGGKAQH